MRMHTYACMHACTQVDLANDLQAPLSAPEAPHSFHLQASPRDLANDLCFICKHPSVDPIEPPYLTYMHACMHAYAYAYACICMHMHAYACMHACSGHACGCARGYRHGHAWRPWFGAAAFVLQGAQTSSGQSETGDQPRRYRTGNAHTCGSNLLGHLLAGPGPMARPSVRRDCMHACMHACTGASPEHDRRA